uniref:ATPase family AAA domain-containing protein 2 n=1 Tax=Hucho hucho TaxID=62062 RepID=A0A4W5KCR4_9TELE
MVMLRSSGAELATPKRNRADLDTSSEFLSLESASQTKSSRLKRGLDDSSSNTENTRNGHSMVKEEDSPPRRGTLRTRGQTVKHEVSLAKMNGQTKCPTKSPEKEEETGEHGTRKSPRLQGDGKASASYRDKQSESDDTDEGEEEEASTLKTQFVLRPREEDSSVRRSSRITRYKRNSRNQSVLYNRLITNTAEAVLQKMDDMQKMRRRLRSRDTTEEDLVIYPGAKRKRTSERTNEGSEDPQEKENGVTSSEEENDEEEGGKNNQADDEDDDDDDDRDEDDDDEEEDDDDDDHDEDDNQKRYDFRQRKAAVRYQAPREEPKTKAIFFKTSRHLSPSRRRYRFSSTGPRSPYNIRRGNRRRHAIHSSDSTSSSSSSSSSSDDEKFQKRRRKSRNRSVNRCLPMNLLKEDVLGIHKDRMKIGASLADVDPMQIDQTVRFDSIGGLTRHISALKEMVVFPLLYPEVFERFKIQPPRGCLFYGPPGTGKTLVARALANECSQGERKVSFFMRKGADCLSKWVGESERQLRLLFDQAYQMRPSIIFFDEVDGLAPVRSSRQDQIHSSIVSTLLALMDGLDSRGEVVVIGATNRLDSIDPALRRPGRFDREFLFGLPDREARKDILQIHTRQWTPQPSASFLEELADKCVGYCGADMKAVCAEAALCALRRRYPQIYSSSQKLVLDVASISIGSRDFLSAMRKTVPASQRAVSSPAKALTPVVQPLLGAALQTVLGTVSRLFPHAEQGLRRDKRDNGVLPAGVLDDGLLHSEDEDSSVCINGLSHKAKAAGGFLHFSRSVLNQPTSYRPRLLLAGGPGSGQSSHLAPAVLHALEKFTVYTLDMAVLFGVSTTSPEEACAQMFCEAKRTSPSILYIPHIQRWWDTVGSALRATFLSLLQDIPSFSPILLLATCNVPHSSLFPEVQDLFCAEYGEVLQVQVPTPQERRNFFDHLILNQAAKAPASKKKAELAALEVLPVAPPLPPRMLSEKEQQRLEEQEEDTLRELRLFLRDVTNRLSQDKRFKAFTKPVDLEEVPDYATVIEQPMDLSTVLSNIDTHKYVTVKEFVHDVDLIWKNCLEYNPDKDPSDRQIRHRACALKDTVQAIVKDELDEDFEKICEDIKESRSTRGCSTSRFAPSYYHVHPKTRAADAKSTDAAGPSKESTAAAPSAVTTPRPSAQKKKRRKSRWCNGIIRKRSSPHTSKDHSAVVDSGEEEEEEEEERRGAESEEEEEEEGGDAAESGLEELEITGAEERPMEKDAKFSQTTEEARQARVEEAVEARAGDQSSEGTQDPVVGQESTTDTAEPQRVEEENTTEVGVRRVTLGLKYQGMQQVMNVDQEILDQKTKPPVVDHNKLKELLQRAVSKTEGYEVYQLEKLYALLCQSIYRHRKDYDKTALLKEMENEIEDFS